VLFTRRILIVEDDPDTREMLGRFLEIAGYEVEQAANGSEALRVLRRGATASVILLDLMMPVMDGWQFREEQRRDPSLAHIPVVVVTAAGPRDRVPPIDADAWLGKPIDLDGLLETVAAFCPA
jgi:CheY-like chemotaxis protein